MNREALRKIDLHLMVVFEAVMQELNVTRAGERLNLTQPAVSACLNRLRDRLGDKLFIRNGQSMEPTARAIEILGYLSPALDSLSLALSKANSFDPLKYASTFKIGISDDVEVGLLAKIVKALDAQAPNAQLSMRPINSQSVSETLIRGDITLAITPTTSLPANAISRPLRKVSLSVLRADNQPGPLSASSFKKRTLVLVESNYNLKNALYMAHVKLEVSPKQLVVVPRFSSIPMLLSENKDFLAIVPDYVAEAISSISTIRAEPVPLALPELSLPHVWLQNYNLDPAEQWLRKTIRDAVSNLPAE